MKEYIGVKVVKAEPLEKNGEKGYKVIYEDSYESWSPKDVFEKAYKSCKLVADMEKASEPHQFRVLSEYVDLVDNLDKLQQFIYSLEEVSIFKTLPIEEQDRLKQQLYAMKYYVTILVERIENFK